MPEPNRVPLQAQRWTVCILMLAAAGVAGWAGLTYLLRAPQQILRERISREAAEQSVRALIFGEKPGMNPTAVFPLRDITTDEVWSRLHLQIFQVTEGVQAFETFVLDGKTVHRIGRGFGGAGVQSTAVADLNEDGSPELVFAYSWGSGTHRSEIGIFSPSASKPTQQVADQVYFGSVDWTLERVDDRTVRVLVGKTPIGNVHYDSRSANGICKVNLVPGLPSSVLRQIRALGG